MNIWKILPLFLIGAIGAFLLGYNSYQLTYSYDMLFNFSAFLDVLLIFAIAITLFLFGFVATVIVVKDAKIQTIIALVLGLLIITGFIGNALIKQVNENTEPQLLPILIFSVLVLIGILSAVHNANRSYYNLIKPHLGSVFSSSGKSVLFFLSMAIALSFLLNNNTVKAQENLTQEVSDYIAKTTSTIVKSMMQTQVNNLIDKQQEKLNENLNETVNSKIEDLLGNITDSDLITNLITSQTGGLTNVALDKMDTSIKENANEQIDNLEIEKMVHDQVMSLMSPFTKYFAPFFAFMLFFTINMTFGLVMLIAPLISSLLIWILRKFNYLKEEKEMVEVTRFKV